MAIEIWPTANDVTGTSGNGANILEQQMCKWFRSLVGQNFVLTGFTMPASDVDLTISVAAGTAVIDGHHVEITTATNVLLTANDTNYIWLTVEKDVGGNVDNAIIQATLTGSNPGDSVGLGVAITASASTTSITDTRYLAGVVNHTHTSNSSGKGGILDGNAVGGYDATLSGSLSASTTASTASVSHSNTGTSKVVINAHAFIEITVAGVAGSEMVIRRDGTVIGNVTTLRDGGCGISIVDDPNPAAVTTYTYDVAFRRTAGGSQTDFTATDIHLTVFSVV